METMETPKTIWDRTRDTVEKILHEGEKTAERAIESFEDLGEGAKRRLDQARLERQLHKRFAELGRAVYEWHQAAAPDDEKASSPLLGDTHLQGCLDRAIGVAQELEQTGVDTAGSA